MRVVIMSHLFPSAAAPGRGVFVAEQARALAGSADVSVLSFGSDVDDEDTVRDGVPVSYRRLHCGTGRIGLALNTIEYSLLARQALRALDPRPELVHVHFAFPDAVVAAGACAAAGIPWVATLHGSDVERVVLASGLVGAWTRRALEKASRVLCVHEEMTRRVRDALRLPPSRIVTVGNGYDDSLFALSILERADFLFVGALRDVKAPADLLRAYARSGVGRGLRIVGDGPLRASLEALAFELGVADRVTFLGRAARTVVAEEMAHARALILPSRSEGMPIVVMEALASGTPVVATRVGALPALLSAPGTGVLFESGDIDALAEALRTLDSEPSDAPSVRMAASHIRSWERVSRDIVSVYGSVLSDPGRADTPSSTMTAAPCDSAKEAK